MVGFAFINMIPMILSGLIVNENVIKGKWPSYSNAMIYLYSILIILQIILHSFFNNINIITKNLYISLDKKYELALIGTQGLLIILNIVIQILLNAKLNENSSIPAIRKCLHFKIYF